MMRRPENRKRKWRVMHLSIRSMFTAFLSLTLTLGLLHLLHTTLTLTPSLRSSSPRQIFHWREALSSSSLTTGNESTNYHVQEILENSTPSQAPLDPQSHLAGLSDAPHSYGNITHKEIHREVSHPAVGDLTKGGVGGTVKNVSSKISKPSMSKKIRIRDSRFEKSFSSLKENSSQVQVYRNSTPSMMVNVTQISLINETLAEKTLKKLCSEGRPAHRVDLVIIILSHVQGFERRQTLRDTWLSPFRHDSSVVRHVFLVGQDSTAASREAVWKLHQEMETHLDIVQAEINDYYNHLTYKTLLGFSLVSTWCRHARHVLKADLDVWVNLPSLLTYLSRSPLRLPEGLGGFCRGPRRPIRRPHSKYFIPKELYPHHKYPVYCNGPGYVTTPEVAGRIVAVSSSVPFFRLEDVYVAFCLHTLGLQLRHIRGFGVWPSATYGGALTPDLCRYHGDRVFLRHGFGPQQLRNIWAAGRCQEPGGFAENG